MSALPPGTEPSRAEIDDLREPLLLEFGAAWCGHCRAVAPLIASALAAHPRIRHLRIEDGPGRRLGRSFGVKLWPTLIFLDGGRELARLVRPVAVEPIADALARLDTAPQAPDAAAEHAARREGAALRDMPESPRLADVIGQLDPASSPKRQNR